MSRDDAMEEREDALNGILKVVLNPRQYQSQLFEKAKDQNVIAWLSTGSGKTLISVLLLKHIFNLDVKRCQEESKGAVISEGLGKRKVSLFLVNKIPLVRQQAQVILNNSFLKVAELYGEYPMGLDLAISSSWDTLFRLNKYDVVVSTAQVILDGLVHGFLKIQEIDLIIFDEAHHAFKNDSYARIMQQHYFQTPHLLRPKIFGMTASPLKTFGDFYDAVGILERTLDAKIYTASVELKKEMDIFFTPPQEHMIEYDPPKPMPIGDITQMIRKQCGHLEGIEKTFGRMYFNDVEYGPLFSDLAWLGNSDEFKGRIKRKLQQAGAVDSEFDLLSREWIQTEGMKRMQQRTQDETDLKKRTKYVNDAAANSAICEILRGLPPLSDTITVDESNTQPKLLSLLDILRTCGSTPMLREQFCCILFVKRQQTAIALTELLERISDLKEWLRPEWITGHNSDYGEGMDPRAQAETLSRFGKPGSTNMLVATTVAEEGLDISPCNCVIRFDLFDHHAGYVQSKGRARHRSSLFIVMLEKNNKQHIGVISSIRSVEQDITQYLLRLPLDQGAVASLDTNDHDSDDEDYNDQPTITSSITGASLRPLDCVSIVCRYVGSLSRDEFSPQKPEFFQMEDELLGYRVDLRFPANSKIRIVEGPWCKSKRKASRIASFIACSQLYQLGELNENLLPRKVKKRDSIEDDTQQPAKLAIKRPLQGHFNSVSRKVPSMYSAGIPLENDYSRSPVKLHGIILHTEEVYSTDRVRPLILLLPTLVTSLPAVELVIRGNSHTMPATKDSVEYHFTHDQVRVACQYTLKLLNLLSRRTWQGYRLPYLILPSLTLAGLIGEESMIDWTEVHRLADAAHGEAVLYDCGEEQKVAEDLLLCNSNGPSKGRLYQVKSVRKDLNPYSIIPGSTSGETIFDNICKKHYYRTRGGENKATPAAPSPLEPLFEAISVSRPANYLPTSMERKIGARDASKERLLIPSMTWVVPCSASVYQSCCLLPSLLQRYEQVALVRDLNNSLFDGHLDEELLMEALTLSKAGQIIDYQKLEFYGDCYLKMMATCWSFAKCESDREGDLNGERKDVISNSALLVIIKNKKLVEYATSQRLHMKTWKPPFLSIKGRSVENKEESDIVEMSNKTMSDLVESILGAAWIGGDDMDLSRVNECASRLEILGSGVQVDMNHFKNLFEDQVKKRETEETWHARVEVGTLTRLEEELGYTFTSPHLALEAVTHGSTLCSVLPSYERLEFLGDAILDFYVVRLFRHRFPHLNPGQMTAMKGNAISNASLAVLCIDLGLHRFLMHSSKVLAQSVVEFRDNLKSAREEVESKGVELIPYWLDLQPPKVLADIVEAMLGAVFVDSGFNLLATMGFFEGKLQSHFDTYFRPSVAVIRTNHDFVQIVNNLQCTQWSLEVEDVEGDRVCTSITFHGKTLVRYISSGGTTRSDRIREYKADLEEILVGLNRKEGSFVDNVDGRSLKAALQYCFPKDYIRYSAEIRDGEEIVDLKEQNRCTNLQAFCKCWKEQAGSEVEVEEDDAEASL